MIQLIIALAIAAVAAGGGFVAGMRIGTAEVHGWIEQVAVLDAKLDEQSRAVRQAKAEATMRIAAADEARKRAEAGVASLAARVQSLLAEKSGPDPCESACRLLSRPL